MTAAGAGELRSLTGVRGVAATLVMLDHYAAVDFAVAYPLVMLPHCYLAVDMFMLLSGFVLAMSYAARAGEPAAYRRFLARRVARLWPLYALTTLVCFGLVRLGWLTFLAPDDSLPALAANLLAVQTWAWPGTSLNGPGWSISAEWAANLLFPACLVAVLGGSMLRAAAVALAAAAMLLACAILFGQLFDVPAPGAVNMISGPPALGRCISEFVLGMVCWRVRSRTRWAAALAGDGTQAAMLAALFGLILWPELDVAFVLVSAALLVGLSFDRSAIARAFGSGAPRFLGLISYSIYLVHITLLPVRDALAGAGAPWPVAVLATACLALGLAVLTWRFVERPGQRWLLRAFAAGPVRRLGVVSPPAA